MATNLAILVLFAVAVLRFIPPLIFMLFNEMGLPMFFGVITLTVFFSCASLDWWPWGTKKKLRGIFELIHKHVKKTTTSS